MKTQLSILCALYTVFVIYGSLVPLEYKAVPMEEAWDSFRNIRYLNLGIESRADWVANILLFIPLAFLWIGRFSLHAGRLTQVFLSVFVFVSCVFLCLSIEFSQLFFPQRTVSLNDIIAETFGAIIGVGVWWLWGGKFLKWFETIYIKNTDPIFYLKIYLGGLFFYNVMPLDLTLSPVELYHKWHEGRIILLPFSGLKGDFFNDAYEIATDIILWCPLPWLWSRQLFFTTGQLLFRVFISASVIELLQLFVYSRVTDTTDVLLAVVGGVIGLLSIEASTLPGRHRYKSSKVALSIAGYCLWCGLLLAVFWYPYNFDFDAGSSGWKRDFFKLPFSAYYFGSEFRAVTEVIHKSLLFLPLGILSHLIIKKIKPSVYLIAMALVLIGCVAFIVEIGQIFLPNKNVDITDWFLEVMGGYLGLVVSNRLASYSVKDNIKREYISYNSSTGELNSIKRNNIVFPKQWFEVVAIFFGGVGVLVFIGGHSAIPYNVRELFYENYPLVSAFGIMVLLYWCFAYPLYFVMMMLRKGWPRDIYTFRLIFIHGVIAWLLVRIILPLESVHDIVGSPVLAIPGELEIALRFLALFAIYSLMLTGAICFSILPVFKYSYVIRLMVLGLVGAILLIPISYWVVVVEADTDNLTELMSNGGYSLSVVNIPLYMLLFSWVGALIAVLLAFKKVKWIFNVLTFFVLSFPLGYQLVSWGTERVILKYDSVFSALQFLLSTDRQNLVSDQELRNRFFMFHFSIVFIVTITHWSVWRLSSLSNKL